MKLTRTTTDDSLAIRDFGAFSAAPGQARKLLPVASKTKRGRRTVRPSAMESAKLGVYQAMTEQGIK